MKMFMIGSGFSVQAVVHILDRWLQSGGVHPNSRIDGRPAAQVAHEKLSRRFGSTRFAIDGQSLFVQDGNKWAQVVHRDDIQTWLFGKEVSVQVGQEPDPSEKGIKVRVGIMEAEVKAGADGKLGTADDEVKITPKVVVEYEEIEDEDGKTSFKCGACDKMLRTEKGIIAHIERGH